MLVLMPGSQVDQFRIVRQLGQGGMSVVYLARDTVLGRKVALKVVHAELADSARRVELFLHEARLTAKFAHPHIIAIHSVGKFEGHPYLALEYLEGQTLSQRMREGAMSAREAIRIGLAIAQALEEAHSHGVLHRDLKPANVIIAKDGRLRVLDFGISKIEENTLRPSAPPKELTDEIKQEETVFGKIKGTPNYMAPERWLGEKVTGAADVWALGVILYQILAQIHPFPGEDRRMEAIAQRILSAQQAPSLPSGLDVPSELSDLITSMLDAQTSRRPTAKQCVKVLQGLLQRRRGQSLENRSPFRGLLPFSERYADLFFGRSSEIEMALERLRHEPILPVVGPSGAGKSSFVAAGIVPRLRDLDRWLVLNVRPGTDPFGALSSSIQAAWRGDIGNTTSPSGSAAPKFIPKKPDDQLTETEIATQAKIATQLSQQSIQIQNEQEVSSEGLAQKLLESPATLLLELQALADETRSKVLLFVDQLEELYTLEHTLKHRRSYMEAISRAADDPDGPIRVVFTLREDFISRVAESPLARETLSHIMVLGAPGVSALSETVTKPVELAGYSYEDLGLPEEMLDAVQNASSSLPLLQFACSQLWNRRDTEKRLLTRAAYEEMGGVEGALASKADELLAGISEVQQNVVRQLVLRLVTPERTRRVITAQELLDGLDSSAVLVLDRLTSARMVVSRRALGRESSEAELELVHDSLIHSWKPLVRWLEQSREEVVFLDEVSRAAELWDSRGRPREEVWSGDALDEARARIKRCEAIPQRITEFLKAGELQRQAHARRRRNIRFLVIGALLSVIAVLVIMNQQTEIQRNRERQARASALREGARAAFTKGDFLEARSKLRASFEARDSTQARALWWLLENEPQVWSKSLDSDGIRVSVSPNGRLIAVSSQYINIYDTKTLERRVLSGHKKRVAGIDFSPNGRWLSSGAYDHEIRIWDLSEDTSKVFRGHSSAVVATTFSPDGKRLASGGRDKNIIIWDIESGTPIRTLKTGSVVYRLSFSPNGRFIIPVFRDDKVRFWNAQTYELEKVIREPGMQIFDTVTSTDGKFISYGGSDGVFVVRDLETWQELARISVKTSFIRSLNFSGNGELFAASTEDGKVLVWDTKTWSLREEFHHTKVPVLSVTFLPDEEHLVAVSSDGVLSLWKMNVSSFRKVETGGGYRINAIAFAPDGKTLVTGRGIDGELRLWNAASGQSIRRIQGYDSDIYDISFNHNGKLLASGSLDGSIRLFNFHAGSLLKTLYHHKNTVYRVLFSQNGTQLVSSSNDGTISFWDLESLTLIKSVPRRAIVNYIDIDLDGRLLASVDNGMIQVSDIETDQVLETFSGHTDVVFSLSFSPDGKSLYSSSFDNTVCRYQLGSASTKCEVVARHQGNIYWIDVTHSEQDILGTPSEDGTAKIWKIGSSDVITLKGHTSEVNSVRFSPDGSSVATASDDSTLRLWDTKSGRPLWRAPLMLENEPLLFTQQGWISADDEAVVTPSVKQWHKALEERGKIASATTDQETLCLITYAGKLEIWNISNDECILKTEQPGIHQVLAVRQGCLMRSDEGLTLTKYSGDRVSLGTQVDAMSRLDDSVFVLQQGKARVLDSDGNQIDGFTATLGASALTIVGAIVAFGFPDGRLEVWRKNESSAERDFACREVESSAVTTIIPGPPGTIIAGYANGAVGIWSRETGERLYIQRLHGPVKHLLHYEQSLLAATELGSWLQLDLSTFYTEYCELMERVWSSVPWIWEEGRPRFRERPTDHICASY